MKNAATVRAAIFRKIRFLIKAVDLLSCGNGTDPPPAVYQQTTADRGSVREHPTTLRSNVSGGGRADPPLPSILRDDPVLLLDLQPPPRRSSLVRAGLVLGNVALVAACDHLLPRLQAIGFKAPHRQHEVATCDDILQSGATITQRPPSQIAAVTVEQIEHHEHRWRGDGSRVWLAQPLETGAQPLVEDGNLAVEHQ